MCMRLSKNISTGITVSSIRTFILQLTSQTLDLEEIVTKFYDRRFKQRRKRRNKSSVMNRVHSMIINEIFRTPHKTVQNLSRMTSLRLGNCNPRCRYRGMAIGSFAYIHSCQIMRSSFWTEGFIPNISSIFITMWHYFPRLWLFVSAMLPRFSSSLNVSTDVFPSYLSLYLVWLGLIAD